MLKIENNVLTIVRKDTAEFDFTINGYTFAAGDKLIFTVAEELDSEVAAITKTVTTFDGNKATFELTSDDTNLEPGTYYYDIQLNGADGSIDTVSGPGKFKVVGGVTW